MRVMFFWAFLWSLAGAEPRYDTSRVRSLESWKRQIAEYSRRHYGEADWRLEPKCIVLHYTAGTTFPWNLVNSPDFAGETPGLASHYVVDGSRIWQVLPPEVRSRGAYGINHRAINIEMVAANASDLYSNRKRTLDTTVGLVRDLLERFHLTARDIYSHQQVAEMNVRVCPWVLDLVNPDPYSKVDPGSASMRYVLERLAR
ncbi:MAG: peptidoglycan recognition family protein [Vulcanimicrobiota bacterium]